MVLPACFPSAHLPPHTQDVGRCRHEHTSRTTAEQAAFVGRLWGAEKKAVADRSAQMRSTPQSTATVFPHKKVRPRHAQGISVCLPAPAVPVQAAAFIESRRLWQSARDATPKKHRRCCYERLDPFPPCSTLPGCTGKAAPSTPPCIWTCSPLCPTGR